MKALPVASGSCLCGAVRFEVRGSFDAFFLCHCSRCRKGSGSAHGANLFASNAELRWRAGEAHVRTYQLPGTRHERSFCAECGSALPDVQQGGALLKVPAGSLDAPIAIRPTAHICCASRADWDTGLEQVPAIDRLPGWSRLPSTASDRGTAGPRTFRLRRLVAGLSCN